MNFTLGRTYRNIKEWEDCGPAGLYIAEVEEHGSHPVLANLHGLVHSVEVVHVGLIMTPDAVGDNLKGLGNIAIETHSSASRVAKMSHQCIEF